MFKEQNERKENTVRSNDQTTHPQFLRLFDDYDQYLDFLSVWYGSWSSCDAGHMERTDFSDEDCFGGADNVDISGESGADDVVDDTDSPENSYDFGDDGDAEWFLEKDRSRALRRRSTALHKLHVQDVWDKLSKRAVPCKRHCRRASYAKTVSEVLSYDPTRTKLYELPSAKVYKRMSFPRGQSVELTTLYDELDAIIDTLTNEEYFDIIGLFHDRYSLEASYLYPSEHTVSMAPIFSKRGMYYKKYAELYSRKTHHEKKRAKNKNRIAQRNEDTTVDVASKCNEKVSESSNSGKRSFVDRHTVGLRSTTPALPVNLQGTSIPVVLAKPQHITLVFPYVSTAGLPFHR